MTLCILRYLIVLLCAVSWTCAQEAGSAPHEFGTDAIRCTRQSEHPFLGYLCVSASSVLTDHDVMSIRELAKSLISASIYSVVITCQVDGNVLQDQRDKVMFTSPQYWLDHRLTLETRGYLSSIIRIGDTEWIRAKYGDFVTGKSFRNGIESIGPGVAEPVYLYGTVLRGETLPVGGHGVVFMKVSPLNASTCADAARMLLYNLEAWKGYVRCKEIPQFFAETNFYAVYPFLTDSEKSVKVKDTLVRSVLCEGVDGYVKCWYSTDEGE